MPVTIRRSSAALSAYAGEVIDIFPAESWTIWHCASSCLTKVERLSLFDP